MQCYQSSKKIANIFYLQIYDSVSTKFFFIWFHIIFYLLNIIVTNLTKLVNSVISRRQGQVRMCIFFALARILSKHKFFF